MIKSKCVKSQRSYSTIAQNGDKGKEREMKAIYTSEEGEQIVQEKSGGTQCGCPKCWGEQIREDK